MKRPLLTMAEWRQAGSLLLLLIVPLLYVGTYFVLVTPKGTTTNCLGWDRKYALQFFGGPPPSDPFPEFTGDDYLCGDELGLIYWPLRALHQIWDPYAWDRTSGCRWDFED